MSGEIHDITRLTKENTDYRRVIYTDDHTQIVLMNLKPQDDIPEEVHPNLTQIFHIVDGVCMAVFGKVKIAEDGEMIIIPAGTKHQILNPSEVSDLKLYTIYSPPEHPPGTVHVSREEALAEETRPH